MMMANADEGSLGTDMLFCADDEGDDVLIDIDSLWSAMETTTDPSSQGIVFEDLSSIDFPQDLQIPKEVISSGAKISGFVLQSPSHNSDASDNRTGCSDGFSESAGTSAVADRERPEASWLLSCTEPSCSESATDCIPVQGNDFSHTHAVAGSYIPPSYCQVESGKAPLETHNHIGTMSSYSVPSSNFKHDSERSSLGTLNYSDTFSPYSANTVIHDGGSSEIYNLNHEQGVFGFSVADAHYENSYHQISVEKPILGTYVAHMEDESIINGDRTSHDASHSDSSSYENSMADIPDHLSGNGGLYLLSSDDRPYYSYSTGFESLVCDGSGIANTMDGAKNSFEDYTSVMPYAGPIGNEFGHHMTKGGTADNISLNAQVGVNRYNDLITIGNESKNRYPNALSNVFSKTQDDIKVKKNIESVTSNEIVCRTSEVINDAISRKYYGGVGKLPAKEGVQWSSSSSLSLTRKNNVAKDEKGDEFFELKRNLLSKGMVGETPKKLSPIRARGCHPILQAAGQPGILPPASGKAETNCQKLENEVPKFNGYRVSNITCQGVRDIDDDSDLCILEDISAPARPNPTALNGKLVPTSPCLASSDPSGQMATGHSRLKPNNERIIFRVAVQDLSQPKSEASPPAGVLAVPLLKHQRVALSWMVNKETKSACCSGGILADDQGLGKTVSTIALILTERSPSSKAPKANREPSKAEMLNLDEDDGASETYYVKELGEVNGGKTCQQPKGRPAAGTLIVCPTSVLRQWSEELHNKVTSEADLSVLVYHGSNRTKDPCELAKYDVVITTYAIVSMEVPKQSVVDENDDQSVSPVKGLSSSKKRKLLEMSGKKPSTGKKGKKGINKELFDSISGPLAKVGWFRVVLDEAQSIKNHRTQVARACWGLRSKRRWCLSGTPIQNAIDDLYSYFRFLRHEPYAIFKTFWDQLKAPINRNPKDGYKKLQAVLKTIMLRRTKGSFIDGEPIINLPPKTIELRKVEFSKDERNFYCRLEADSRAQFAEYAAAGTVKQNYVNILLMLLRLRQACDHPLLVKGFNSNSQVASSIEMAKKLPQEKHKFLLNCLEASLAICGICSDPPEDAVVTVCGHVFCNQCICEHMMGDDTQCPTKNCKTHLTMSHVFSITTLRLAVSDQQTAEKTPTCSGSELSESLRCPQGSSKIKAALELIVSLSKPHRCYKSEIVHSCDSVENNGASNMKIDLNSSVKVVGEKAIVFSQWTRMLDLLEATLKNSSIQYRRLDGTMPVVARDRAVKDFNSIPEVSVMIMSLKAASLGLNMVAACNVILLDLWWNPTTEDQAIDRAHRIGQTRPVSVFRLTVKDTVEDRILALQERKREMVASAFGEDRTGSRQTRLTVEDLKYLFRVD